MFNRKGVDSRPSSPHRLLKDFTDCSGQRMHATFFTAWALGEVLRAGTTYDEQTILIRVGPESRIPNPNTKPWNIRKGRSIFTEVGLEIRGPNLVLCL